MKKFFILLLAVSFSGSLLALTAPVVGSKNAKNIMVPIAKGKLISFDSAN